LSLHFFQKIINVNFFYVKINVKYTKSQLADMFGISRPTLNKRLKEVGLYEKGRSLFTLIQVTKILEIWGIPN